MLNSKLAISYIKEKYSSASYNGGIVFTKDMINNLPVNLSNSHLRGKIIDVVDDILAKKAKDSSSNIDDELMLIDMYVFQLYDFKFEELSDLDDGVAFSEATYEALQTALH